MANKKYETQEQRQIARRASNRGAQQRYRDRVRKQRQAPQAPLSDSTLRGEGNEEAPIAVGTPDANAPDASHEVEDAQVERRMQGPSNAPLTPLDYLASMEQAIDGLLPSLEDPSVQKSLQDPIIRINLKFRNLVHRVQKTEKTPVQRDARIVSRMQYHPYKWNAASSIPRRATANPTQSLYGQLYGYGTQCAPSLEIRRLCGELERAMQPTCLTVY